jgi:hypothetical protein
MHVMRNSPTEESGAPDVVDGVGRYALRGQLSLVEAVDRISRAIAHCRERGVDRLLIDARDITGVPVPTLVERFLMAEDWAHAAKGMVTVAMVAPAEYIHPQKFGMKVAAHLGLVCDVHTSAADALQWLLQGAPRAD